MPSDKEVLRALAAQAMESGAHPDRGSVLQEFLDDQEDTQEHPTTDPTEEGQGPGGEGGKTRDSKKTGQGEDEEGDGGVNKQSPTTAPETGSQRGKAGK